MGSIYSLDDLLDMVRRRFGVIFGVTLLGAVLSFVMALNTQHLYRSFEVLQIARPQIADELAPSTVAGSSGRRLQLIQQQIMTRDVLLDVIEKYGLFSELPHLTTTEKVIMLREAVSIEGIAAAREGFTDDGTISVLTVAVTLPSPEQARLVAEEFSRRTQNLSAQSRIDQARATLDFFDRQQNQLEQEIARLENEITEFRRSNDLLATGAIETQLLELASINDAVLGIDRDRISLERQLQQVDRTARQSTVDREVADITARLTSLDEQRALLVQRAERLNAQMRTNPELERIQADYDRQMTQLQLRLTNISARRNDAEIGFRLENQRQAERLTVIEPASIPDYPITSSRKRQALIGAAASVVMGLVLAFLLDLRTPVIRTAAQMKREIGLTPVVSIPFLDTRPRRKSLWRRLFPGRGGPSNA